MIRSPRAGAPAALVLPPAFTGVMADAAVDTRGDAFAQACRLAAAGAAGAGTLVLAAPSDIIQFAVVLEPDEPLASARRAFLAGMVALAEAVGAHGPPEMPATFLWPDTLLFNAARIGGGRLGWPPEGDEAAVPEWLVFGASVIAAKPGDPGLTPNSTSLADEAFPEDVGGALAESFARHLTKAFEIWREDGFDALAARYLARLCADAPPAGIDREGNLILAGAAERLPLLPALRTPAWRDPATGTVRL